MRCWLKELRLKKKWSQTEAAKRMGLTRQAYSYIEAGERQADMNLSLAAKISQVFKISLKRISDYEN